MVPVGIGSRRLLLVAATLEGGGAERQLSGMANYWAAKHVDVMLATWSGSEVPDGFPLDPRVRRVHLGVAFPGGGRSVLAFALECVGRLRGLMREQRPEAVISFITSTNVLVILAAAGLGMRVVVSERVHPEGDTTATRPWRLLRRMLYRFSDVIVVQTGDAADWMRAKFGKKPFIVPNALRELSSGSDSRGPIVLAAGRLVRQKGFDVLLRAFAVVADRYPEWSVVILGEGPERDSLLELRDALGLTERVTLAGYSCDIEHWMGRAGLVVQPSRFEGFPNVVLEAMGMGAAVISADCRAGPSELISDGVDGRLVPVEDVGALAVAMAELIAQPELRARLGREALKVRQRFHPERIMALWESALFAAGTAEERSS